MNKYIQPGNGRTDRKTGNSKDKFIRTNWKIRARLCRIIVDNKQPEVMSTQEALDLAKRQGLDLIEINYDYKSDTSTCRIYDYGKFVYEQKRREKEAKKQAKANLVEVKNLQLTLTTDTADLNRMIEHAKEFLANGDKVRIALRFRGRRELEQLDMAKEIVKNVLTNFDGIAILDSAPALNNKELSCVIRPVRK